MELNCGRSKLESYPNTEAQSRRNSKCDEEEQEELEKYASRSSGEETHWDCTDGLDFCELLAKFESVVHSFITEYIELQIYDPSKAEIPRHYNLKLKIKLMNHVLKKFEPNVRKQLQEEVLGTMCHILCNQRRIYKNSVTNQCCSNYPEILCVFMQETNRDFSMLISRLRNQHLIRADKNSFRAEIANQQLQQLDCRGSDVNRPMSPRVIPDRHYLHVLDQVFKADCCSGHGSVYTLAKCTEFPPPNAKKFVFGLPTAIDPAAKHYVEEKKIALPPLDLCGSRSFRAYGTALGGYGRMKMNEVAALQTFEESLLNYTLTSKCVPVLWCGSNRKGQPLLYSTQCETDLSPIPLPMPCGPCGPLIQLYPSGRCGKKPRPSTLVRRKGKKHKKLKKRSKPEPAPTEDAASATDGEGDSKKEKKKKNKKGKGKKKGKSKGRSKKKGKSKGGSKKKGKSKGGSKKGKGKSRSGSKTKMKKGKGKSHNGSKTKMKKGSKSPLGEKGKRGDSNESGKDGKPPSSSSATGTDDPKKKSRGVGTSGSKIGLDKKNKGTQANDKRGGKNKGTSAVPGTSDDESQTGLGKSKSKSGQTGKDLSRSPSRSRGKKGRGKNGKVGTGSDDGRLDSKGSESGDSQGSKPSRSRTGKKKGKGLGSDGSTDDEGRGKYNTRDGKGGKRGGRSPSEIRWKNALFGKRGPSRSATNRLGSPSSRRGFLPPINQSMGRVKDSKSLPQGQGSRKSRPHLPAIGTKSKLGVKDGRSRPMNYSEIWGKRRISVVRSFRASDQSKDYNWKTSKGPGYTRSMRELSISNQGQYKHWGTEPSYKEQVRKHPDASSKNNKGYSASMNELAGRQPKSNVNFDPSINKASSSHGPGNKPSSRFDPARKSRSKYDPYNDGTKEQLRKFPDGPSKNNKGYSANMNELTGRQPKSNAKFDPSNNKSGPLSGRGYKHSSGLDPARKSRSKYDPYNDNMKEQGRRPAERTYSASKDSNMKEQGRRPSERTSKYSGVHDSNMKEQVRRLPDRTSKYSGVHDSNMKEQVRRLPDRTSKYSGAHDSNMKEQVRRPLERTSKYSAAYDSNVKEQMRRPTERTSKYSAAYDSNMKEQVRRPSDRTVKYSTLGGGDQNRRPMDHNPRFDPRFKDGMKEQLKRRPSEYSSKYGSTENTSGWRPRSAKSLPILKNPDYMRGAPDRAYRPTLGFVDDTFSSTLANTWCDRRGKPSMFGDTCEHPIDLESPQENFFWVPLGRYSWETRNIKVWKSQVINPREALGSKEYMGIFPEITVEKPHLNMSDLDLSNLSKRLQTFQRPKSMLHLNFVENADTCYL
ncbi:unnamed protein product [Allacma fusca]|uniref:Uncharacterized protein n=1 Tax=Allacma fusca TaxID=39272 RepID=A0A8J2Q2G5_9HEXA|nr:unnamed protein product [Allacma fusca]